MARPCSKELGNLQALNQDATKRPSLFSPSPSHVIHYFWSISWMFLFPGPYFWFFLLSSVFALTLYLISLLLISELILPSTVIFLKHCPNTFPRGNFMCLWFLPIYHRTKSKSLSLVYKTFLKKATYYFSSHSSAPANADSFPQSGRWSPNMVLSTFLTCSSCTSCHILLQSLHWSKSFIL